MKFALALLRDHTLGNRLRANQMNMGKSFITQHASCLVYECLKRMHAESIYLWELGLVVVNTFAACSTDLLVQN